MGNTLSMTWTNRYHRSALLGLGAWLAVLAWLPLLWAEALLLLAPLVIGPLGLALVWSGATPAPNGWAWRLATWLQLPAALALVLSFAVAVGPVAAGLAMPWFLVAALLAVTGLGRLLTRPFGPLAECGVDAALVYLPIGAGWALLYRLGARPLNFDDLIVLLTAAHFHYAGFALPLLTGMAARARPGRLAQLATLAVVPGVPLVALGITARQLSSHYAWLEAAAAWFLAGACIPAALLQLQAAAGFARGQRLGLYLASLALLAGVAMAAVYAWGMLQQNVWLTIPTMIQWHGTLNALGFALTALLVWNLDPRTGLTREAAVVIQK